MALFTKNNRRQRPKKGKKKRQKKRRGKPYPGIDLTKLEVHCEKLKNHPLEVKMKCLGMGWSNAGSSMATYECPMCQWQEGYVRDRKNVHKPYLLWEGYKG